MAYLTPDDLTGATTSYISAQGTVGVDFSLYSNAQLLSLIDRVSKQVDAYCRQTFALTNVQERYMGRGTNILRLRKWPLAQLEDSVFGGAGTVSQSLVCDTTTTGATAKGDTTVPVADCANFLAGQYFQWADDSGEDGIAITAVSPSTIDATGTLTLKSALAKAHDSGVRVVVNTLDYIQIVLPGQSFYPIPTGQLVVDAQKGMIINYTPLMFQNLGYATIFPNMLPLLARYTYGYLAGQLPDAFKEILIEQCRRTALVQGNPGPQGITRWSLDDQSVSYQAWRPAAIESDIADMLGPWRRDIGMY